MRIVSSLNILAVSALIALAACKGKTETCDNGADDDGDGAADCADAECASDAACDGDTDTDETEDEDCNNGSDDDGDGDEDCDDSDCEDDPDCTASDVVTPAYMGSSAVFAYNAEADEVISFDLDGTVLAPEVDIFFADQTYIDSQGASGNSCTLALVYNGTEPFGGTTWEFTYDGDDYVMGGFILPDGEYDVTGDCVDGTAPDIDPEFDIGLGDMATTFGSTANGAGVGTWTPAIYDNVASQVDPGLFFGTGWYWEVLGQVDGLPEEGIYPSGYGQAAAIDAEGHVLNLDGDIATQADIEAGEIMFLEGDEVINEAGVPPTGAYFVTGLYGLGFSSN